jgi:hypothetical protein
MQRDRSCRQHGWLGVGTSEQLAAVFTDHFRARHTEKTLRGLIHTDNPQAFVIDKECVGELVKDGLEDLGPMQYSCS